MQTSRSGASKPLVSTSRKEVTIPAEWADCWILDDWDRGKQAWDYEQGVPSDSSVIAVIAGAIAGFIAGSILGIAVFECVIMGRWR